MKLYAAPFLICILMLLPTQAHNSPKPIELRPVTNFGFEPAIQDCDTQDTLDSEDDTLLPEKNEDMDALTALVMSLVRACSPFPWMYPPHR